MSCGQFFETLQALLGQDMTREAKAKRIAETG